MINKTIDRIHEFILKKKFIVNSKMISLLIKKIKQNSYFYIVDVGAGGRYLRPVINFDGSSKIFMIDLNDNLNVSVTNLHKIVKFKKNIIPINKGIFHRNTTLNYYPSPIPTSSSFIKYDKSLKPVRKKVSTFSTLQKEYKIKKVDILKIDIEGLELGVLKSILKSNSPLIIEIEANFNNSVFGDTFTEIHNFLSKKYMLETAFPTYKSFQNRFNSHLRNFRVGSYASPTYRNPITQMDCYYILKKKHYDINDLLLFLGYGFVDMANQVFLKLKNELNQKQKENFLKILEILND
jgi:FkbM family methyltransferase